MVVNISIPLSTSMEVLTDASIQPVLHAPAGKGALGVLTGTYNGLFQVLETHVFDRFAVSTSFEALYVEEIENGLVDLYGDFKGSFAITLDEYSLRAASGTAAGHCSLS